MIKKYIYLILVFAIVFLFSCSNKKESLNDKVNIKPLSLIISKEKKIKIPSNINYLSFLSQIKKQNDTTFLFKVRTHTKENGIDVFDFTHSKYIKSYILPKDGPNGIDKIKGFFYVNKDSIIIIGTKDIVIYSPKNNNIFYRKVFSEKYLPVSVSNLTKPIFKNNEFYFVKHAFTPPNNNKFFSTNIITKYNLNTNELIDIPNSNFSSPYFDKCWTHYDIAHSHTFNNDKFICSFAIDDSIYVINTKNNLKKSFLMKSDYKIKKVDALNCSKIKSKERNQKYTNYYYSSIAYDKYKNIYYRFLILPIKNFNPKNKYKRINRQFVISIFDDKFNKIGESKIFNIKPKYINFDWFITKEGLWISSSNPNKQDYNENYMTYQLFKYVKK